jgi:recombinational DNA repair ATPase RecF
MGENPQTRSNSIETIRSLRPGNFHRVASKTALTRPSKSKKFVGTATMPTVFESAKNKAIPPPNLVQPHTLSTLHSKDLS